MNLCYIQQPNVTPILFKGWVTSTKYYTCNFIDSSDSGA
jgi:hypothetical protein